MKSRHARSGTSKTDKRVAIFGFQDGAAGQVESWFEEVTGYRIDCFLIEAPEPPIIDVQAENRKRICQRLEYPQNGRFKNRPLIASLDWVSELKRRGIGKILLLDPDNRTRFRHLKSCHSNGIELVSAIHPSALILEDAIIEPGVWINARAVVGYKAEIASGVLINTGAQVDHHNVLRSCCQLAPRATTAGHVTLEECSYLFTGAIVINKKIIGHDAIVGAGAVVIRDIPPECTAVGVPARIIKPRAKTP